MPDLAVSAELRSWIPDWWRMSDLENSTLDLVRELRLRQWARQHFVTLADRKSTWHPVVLDEMHRRDLELAGLASSAVVTSQPVAVNITPPVTTDVTSREIPASQAVHEEYLWRQPSTFVPLAPTLEWSLHAGSSAVPKPHYRHSERQSRHFAEAADIAEFP